MSDAHGTFGGVYSRGERRDPPKKKNDEEKAYLPGGDKEVVTTAAGTIRAMLAAERAVMAGGVVSVTLYPGHAEGSRESQAVLEHAAALDVGRWSVVHTRWPNQIGKRSGLPSPELLEWEAKRKVLYDKWVKSQAIADKQDNE